jgi:hypothetical protein
MPTWRTALAMALCTIRDRRACRRGSNLTGRKAQVTAECIYIYQYICRYTEAMADGTAWRLGVSGRNCCLRKRIVSGVESLPEAGTERAIVDGAANLEQQIGSSPRPAHLLGVGA